MIPAIAAVLAVGVAPVMAHGDPGSKVTGADSPLSSLGKGNTGGDKGAEFDARSAPENAKALRQRAATTQALRPSLRSAAAEAAVNGGVDLDPLTGTPRFVGNLEGFLTEPAKGDASQLALKYVRAHATAFGLSQSDISRLTLRKKYVNIDGTAILSYAQSVDQIPVFGQGLKVTVAKDGRIVNVTGSPVAGLPTSLAGGKLTAVTARAAAIKDLGHEVTASAVVKTAGVDSNTQFANDDSAQRVLFMTLGGLRSGWQTIVRPAKGESYLSVIDAETGTALYRHSLVEHENDPAKPEATGNVWEYFPGALHGGDSAVQNLRGLPADATNLSGQNAHVYLDLDNNNAPSPDEEVGPNADGTFQYPFKNFNKVDQAKGIDCSSHYQCSWDPTTAGSWKTNANQNAVQVYYYLGKFHDHLEAGPIGFTREAGNFDARDGDAVNAEAMDGANSDNGMPGGNSNNANMDTPPDGHSPHMQMYLFFNDGSAPWAAANSGDSADILYHEYTHGLTNRLVVDANGVSTLGGGQAGSMGEGWSDWYAMDFLVNSGYQVDRKNAADLRLGDYVGHGLDLIRTQPMDCKVGSTDAACPGSPTTHAGGYTYADFGKIAGRPEVHADGELWMESLWDLRCEVGSAAAESLVTRALELSAGNPSYLDMRNAILLADNVTFGGKYHAAIWKVFANRGMGFFAGSIDGNDANPFADFHTPPPAGTPSATVSGKVTDKVSGAPIAGALVAFGGAPAATGAGTLATVTDANGDYTIPGVVVGHYGKFSVTFGGYDAQVLAVDVVAGGVSSNFSLVREWAAATGGAKITGFNGADFGMGCNADALLDQTLANGWVADAQFTAPRVIKSRFVVIQLPQAVNVADLKIAPSSPCGTGGSASTRTFSVETSADGVTWAAAANGQFGAVDRGQVRSVPLAAGTGNGVKFVRYTMLNNQLTDSNGNCPGAFDGCNYVGTSELLIYGSAS